MWQLKHRTSKIPLLLKKATLAFVVFYFILHLYYFDMTSFMIPDTLAFIYCLAGVLVPLTCLIKEHPLLYFFTFLLWALLGTVNPYVMYVSYPVMSAALFLFFADSFFKTKERNLTSVMVFFFLANHYYLIGARKILNPEWRNGLLLQTFSQNVPELFFLKDQSINTLQVVALGTALFEMAGCLLILKKSRKHVLLLVFCFHLFVFLVMKLYILTLPYLLVLSWLYFREVQEKEVHLSL